MAEQNSQHTIEPGSLIYSPLEEVNSIRTITLFPGNFEENIVCTLNETNLDQNPDYIALSYVWGDSSQLVSITCNSQPFQVTRNLAQALRRIRITNQPVDYWIDAISINQNDKDERARQVQLMRTIFRSADAVLLYVGEATEEDMDGLQLLMHLNDISEKIQPDITQPAVLDLGSPEESSLPEPESVIWDHFQNFFRRVWFSRIWVLQEAAMATEDPVVLCGKIVIPWSTVARVAQFYHKTGIVLGRPVKDWSYHAIVMDTCRESKNGQPIARLLKLAQKFESTDPSDKIFALYGVSDDMHELVSSTDFQIDYNRSPLEIYCQFTLSHMKFYGSSDILIDVDSMRKGKVSNLPSWVPDWSGVAPCPPFGIGHGSEKYNAAGGTGAVFVPEIEDDCVLRIGAAICDSIVWVSDPITDQSAEVLPPLRTPGVLKRIWDQICTVAGSPKEIESYIDSFWRTLVANVDKWKQPVDESFYIHFLAHWHASRVADEEAENYMAQHLTRPDYEDVETRRRIKIEYDKGPSMSEEYFAALQRQLDTAFEIANIKCTKKQESEESSTECKHCEARKNPELVLNRKLPPVKGPDPALSLQSDIFLKDYFHRLQNDIDDPISIIEGDSNTFLAVYSQVCSRRVFFITERGRLGVGPGESQVGNQIAILSGGSMPFVLRETEDATLLIDSQDSANIGAAKRYNLLGPSYVHGLMNGEGLTKLGHNQYQWTLIDLI
jgi:heterokaryon incompatibility protein (HET)